MEDGKIENGKSCFFSPKMLLWTEALWTEALWNGSIMDGKRQGVCVMGRMNRSELTKTMHIDTLEVKKRINRLVETLFLT